MATNTIPSTMSARRRFWYKHVKAWKNSNLPMVEYANRHKISDKRLSYWKCKLNPDTSIVPALVEVPQEILLKKNVKLCSDLHEKPSVAPPSFILEVSEYRLQIPSDFNNTELLNILACLRKVQCF